MVAKTIDFTGVKLGEDASVDLGERGDVLPTPQTWWETELPGPEEVDIDIPGPSKGCPMDYPTLPIGFHWAPLRTSQSPSVGDLPERPALSTRYTHLRPISPSHNDQAANLTSAVQGTGQARWRT